MTSKKQHNAGAPIPDPIDGYELVSFCGMIPDAREYRSALYGVISALTKWWFWEKTMHGDTRATQAAAYMRETLLSTFFIGEECMFDCDDVELCIRNHPGTIDAILDAVGGKGTTGRQGEIDTIAITGGEVGCDYDIVYGRVSELWNYINARSQDFLEQLVEATIAAERASLLIRAIPGFGSLPIDEAVEWLAMLPRYGYIAYMSQLTTELEVDIKCGLFCLAVDNDCSLTFGMVYDFFVERLGGVSVPTAIAAFLEWIEFMVLGEYPNDRIIYMLSAWQLALAFMGAEFLGIDSISPYAIRVALADPDDDWTLLCVECYVNCGTLSFDDTETDLVYTVEYGNIAIGGNPDLCLHAIEQVYPPYDHGRHLRIKIELAEVRTVDKVSWDLYHANTGFPAGEIRRDVFLQDEDSITLETWHVLGNTVKNEWFADSLSDDAVDGVKFIVLECIFFCDCPGTREIRVDNIAVRCAFDG